MRRQLPIIKVQITKGGNGSRAFVDSCSIIVRANGFTVFAPV